MKNKTLKVILFCFLIFGNLTKNYAQEGNNYTIKQVEGIAKKMFDDINNKDFDAILDMTHPKVFEIVPKDQMKTLFKSMFEGNDQFSIEIPKIIPKYKVSTIFNDNENNLEYAFVSYDMKMTMTFHDQEFDEDAKEMMLSMMKAQGMDADFISKNSMKVLMKDRLTIVLREEATENKWVMINYDPDSPLFYKILSSSLIEKSKEYRQKLMLENNKNSEN